MRKLAITPLVEPEELAAIQKATGGNIRFPVNNGLPTAQGNFSFFPVIRGLKDHGARTPSPSLGGNIIITQVKGSDTIVLRKGGTVYLMKKSSLCGHCLAAFLPL